MFYTSSQQQIQIVGDGYVKLAESAKNCCATTSTNEWIRRLEENTNKFNEIVLQHKVGRIDKKTFETKLGTLKLEQKEILEQMNQYHPKTIRKAYDGLLDSDKQETKKVIPSLANDHAAH